MKKNINKENVEALKVCVGNYKAYWSLYATTTTLSEGKPYSAYGDILSVIKEHADEVLDDIIALLNDLYLEWAGVGYLNYSSNNEAAYYDTLDLITDEYIKEGGESSYIIANDGECHPLSLPTSFMKEFIAEYGIFTIDHSKDVGIE